MKQYNITLCYPWCHCLIVYKYNQQFSTLISNQHSDINHHNVSLKPQSLFLDIKQSLLLCPRHQTPVFALKRHHSFLTWMAQPKLFFPVIGLSYVTQLLDPVTGDFYCSLIGWYQNTDWIWSMPSCHAGTLDSSNSMQQQALIGSPLLCDTGFIATNVLGGIFLMIVIF